MRVFISADIEGVAGVAHFATTGPRRLEWENQGRAWMTGEVVAAITAAREAGATEVVVSDGHGSAHNLLLDDMPDCVRTVRSWPRPLLQMQGIEQGRFDAAIFIGHHSHATSWDGVLSHTFTGAYRDIRLNGVSQSETTLNALVAAEFGVPVIFTSGDDGYIRHCREALPGIETVVTKEAHGLTSMTSLKPAVARTLIQEGVTRALARRHEILPCPIPDRLEVELEFNERSQPEMLSYLPWFQRTGFRAVRFIAATPVEMMQTISFCSFYESKGIPHYGFPMS